MRIAFRVGASVFGILLATSVASLGSDAVESQSSWEPAA